MRVQQALGRFTANQRAPRPLWTARSQVTCAAKQTDGPSTSNKDSSGTYRMVADSVTSGDGLDYRAEPARVLDDTTAEAIQQSSERLKNVAQQREREAETTTNAELYMKSALAFLTHEMPNIFVHGSVSRSKYAADIVFQDPISRYTDIDGYCFNISLLTNLFDNDFELLDIGQTSADTITARWSMRLRAKVPGALPWKPEAVITGVTKYRVDLGSGLITEHIDEWDAVNNNTFLSLEALQLVVRSFSEVRLTPDLETPEYTVLFKNAAYEVRAYKPYTVAEAPMPDGAGPASGSGFPELAGYIFGGNEAKVAMEMTTPVYSTAGQAGPGGGRMQFVMERRFAAAELPAPNSAAISAKVEPARVRAAATFGGFPLDFEVFQAEKQLRDALVRDGLAPKPGYLLARYNEPTVPPFLRRNEVLITLDNYELPSL